MEIKQNVNEWKASVFPALDSKVGELRLMGYSQATREDVWKCLIEKVWKGNPEKRIHQVVQEIMHLKSAVYLSYLTFYSQQNDDLMASITALMNTGKD